MISLKADLIFDFNFASHYSYIITRFMREARGRTSSYVLLVNNPQIETVDLEPA
jgi:hypothetical protein